MECISGHVFVDRRARDRFIGVELAVGYDAFLSESHEIGMGTAITCHWDKKDDIRPIMGPGDEELTKDEANAERWRPHHGNVRIRFSQAPTGGLLNQPSC